MKKIAVFSLILTLLSMTASAQGFRRNQVNRRGEITRLEALDLRRDQQRFKMARFRAHRDGIVTPVEKRKLRKMKRHQRREFFFYKHNRNRRLI